MAGTGRTAKARLGGDTTAEERPIARWGADGVTRECLTEQGGSASRWRRGSIENGRIWKRWNCGEKTIDDSMSRSQYEI